MLQDNQTVSSYDVPETLKNENGFFLVQRAGQSFVVEAREGHSIVSWRPIGEIQAVAITAGTNPPFQISRLTALEAANLQTTRQQYQTAGRG